MDNKVCYVCCCYLGDRRSAIEYYNEDKSVYVKEQIKSLNEFNHDLSKIIFIFNLDPEHIELFEIVKKEIPKKPSLKFIFFYINFFFVLTSSSFRYLRVSKHNTTNFSFTETLCVLFVGFL